jgi:trigger factor
LNPTESAEETKPSCVREVDIEVPADVFAKEVDSLLKRYTKQAKVPGFRPGKVPPSVVKRQFGEGLVQEAVENLVNRVVPEELNKQKFAPVSRPEILDLHAHEGEPLRFKARFEILPEFDVNDYKDLVPPTEPAPVTDEEVEEALKNVQQQHATYNAVEEDRALQDGDFAQVALEGTPHDEAPNTEAAPTEGENAAGEAAEGEPAESAAEPEAATKPPTQPIKVEEVMIEIGNANTVREFDDNLRGAKPGDTRTFDVRYPDDYSDKRLAGKTYTYNVEIKGIKSKSMPELNDDFAKELGDFSTIDAIRTRIREGMEHERRHQADHAAKDQIIAKLVDNANFPVPTVLVEHAIEQRLERGFRALVQQGMAVEDIRKMDINRLRAGQHEAAEREVKAALILDRIAEKENIDVSEAEIDREVQGMAMQYRQPLEKLRESLIREGGLGRIRDTLREQKTIEFLYRGKVPVYEAAGEEQPAPAAEAQAETASPTDSQ